VSNAFTITSYPLHTGFWATGYKCNCLTNDAVFFLREVTLAVQKKELLRQEYLLSLLSGILKGQGLAFCKADTSTPPEGSGPPIFINKYLFFTGVDEPFGFRELYSTVDDALAEMLAGAQL
jgi:hypothetical protein